MGNTEPEAGEFVVGRTPLTLSFAQVENETTAPHAPPAIAVMLAGTVMTGAVHSTTVTVNVRDDVRPLASVAVVVTVVVPNGKVDPDAGEFTVGTQLPVLSC